MKIKPLLASLVTLAFLTFAISCSDTKKKEATNESSSKNSLEFQKKINLDSIPTVKLSEKTKRETEEWIMYIALNSEMQRLREYSLIEVVDNSETIDNVIDSLYKTIPKIFDTNAINARVVTLKTHAKLLQENSQRVAPNPSEIEDLTAKLELDFNNLNIQLNEIFIIEDSKNESDFD